MDFVVPAPLPLDHVSKFRYESLHDVRLSELNRRTLDFLHRCPNVSAVMIKEQHWNGLFSRVPQSLPPSPPLPPLRDLVIPSFQAGASAIPVLKTVDFLFFDRLHGHANRGWPGIPFDTASFIKLWRTTSPIGATFDSLDSRRVNLNLKAVLSRIAAVAPRLRYMILRHPLNQHTLEYDDGVPMVSPAAYFRGSWMRSDMLCA